ncbi:MAG TPA: FAD-dependent oxidoreductase [Ktedonobacterales bacterium]|jgi:dihydrolipoamide dehydrogenase
MVVGDVATAVDVLVLGAGPAGYVGAIRAAQLGRRVTLVDPGPPGGVCLHRGCIPLKALLAASERYHQTRASLEEMGISAGPVSFDWAQMAAWKQGVVDRLSEGVARLLAGNKVEMVSGRGWFINDKEMRVEGEYGSHRFIFEHCLIATGAKHRLPAALPSDGVKILSPEQALALAEFPATLSIIGNDYIALELATLFARLGTRVTLLLPGEALLDGVDPAALRLVQAGLRGLGVQIVANARPVGSREDAFVYTTGEKPEEQRAPLPLVVSLGVEPLPGDELHLRAAGIECEQAGDPVVDSSGRTTNERVYAAGDVRSSLPLPAGTLAVHASPPPPAETLAVHASLPLSAVQPALASVAIKQAKIAAEAMNGARVQYAPMVTPLVALTVPEIASVGLSPQAAQEAGYRTMTGRFPLAANGRALTLGTNAGLALVTADAENEALLGVTLVGPRASDLIGQATLAIEMGATLTDLTEILYAHPTLSETLLEGAEAALGRAIHVLGAALAKAGA